MRVQFQMSEQLLDKINFFKKQSETDTEPHDVLKTLIEINKLIDDCFDNVIKNNDCLDKLGDMLPSIQSICLRYYMKFKTEIHRVRGNIMASIGSLIFVTESKLKLLVNDDEWCDLDQYYREKSQFFFNDDFFNIGLFLEHDLEYQAKHPLVQYSMDNCKQVLFGMLLTTKQYENEEELDFVDKLYNAVRNRIAIISNYAYSQDVNDIAEYVVRINNNRAIPTSCFLYDFSVLCREVERNRLFFKSFHKTHNATDDYQQFFEQVKPTYLKWAANMIVTAAGDDFCALFGKFYCKAHVRHFETLLYRRKFPSVRIVHYKLLQTTRGMKVANDVMQTGNDFVVDLLKREIKDDEEQDELDLEDPDSMCSDETVLERMEKLNPTDFNILMMGIIDYVTERQWKRTVDTFFTRSTTPDVTLEPSMLKVPFSNKVVVFTKSQEPVSFESFYEAFAAWCYHLQRDYEGALYDSKTGEKTICTSQLKKMFAL